MDDLLKNPIKSALINDQKRFSLSKGKAYRYCADIAPFAALDVITIEALSNLAELMIEEEKVLLFTEEQIPKTNIFDIVLTAGGIQMLVTKDIPYIEPIVSFIPLTEADIPEILELIKLTKPGPFVSRTLDMGKYIGIRNNGQLIAMAGERMQFSPYVEISAVCVHPDFRGCRYAQLLVEELMRQCKINDKIPLLHAFSSNQTAINLYHKMGFTINRQFYVTALTKRIF